MARDINRDAELYPTWPANEVVVYTVHGNLALPFDNLDTERAEKLLNSDQKNLENWPRIALAGSR